MKTATWQWGLVSVAMLAALQPGGAAVLGEPQTATLYVTVEDRSSAARELAPRNFRVSEDGVAQKVVRAEPAGPANVVLLVENNLMSWRFLNDVHSAMRGFLQAAPQRHSYALVTYSRNVNVEAGLTPDIEKIGAAYAGLRHTAYADADTLDAIYRVAGKLEELPGRRVIILVGSGLDTFSRHTPGQLRRRLEAANVLVYGIATGSDMRQESPIYPEPGFQADPLRSEMLMRMLATTTGGRMYCPSCEAEYADAMRDIMAALDGQYEVVYERASPPAPGFHKVKVEAFRQEGGKQRTVRVTAREGWRF